MSRTFTIEIGEGDRRTIGKFAIAEMTGDVEGEEERFSRLVNLGVAGDSYALRFLFERIATLHQPSLDEGTLTWSLK